MVDGGIKKGLFQNFALIGSMAAKWVNAVHSEWGENKKQYIEIFKIMDQLNLAGV